MCLPHQARNQVERINKVKAIRNRWGYHMCCDPPVMTLPASPPAPCQFSYPTLSAKEEGGLLIKFQVFLQLDFLQAQLSPQSSHSTPCRVDVNCLNKRSAFPFSFFHWLLIVDLPHSLSSGLTENQPQAQLALSAWLMQSLSSRLPQNSGQMTSETRQ